jgi:putative pyruvate formate lyase activating enzyme
MPQSLSLYNPCCLCPRLCGVTRRPGTDGSAPGYCGESALLRIASASLHRGEEPPLTGGEKGGGSGAIFVSGCSLGCVFCQNRQISSGALGRPVDREEFTRICLALQERGAENINIVTGSHAVPALVEGIAAARKGFAGAALHIPVLWNSSAYELPQTLELLADTVDVFLPDMKTLDRSLAKRFFNAPDYPESAAGAVLKMIKMRSLRFEKGRDGTDRLVSGVMVRHLVLPGCLEATLEVLRWFKEYCAGGALLSLMFQYTPMKFREEPARRGAISPARYTSAEEYRAVLEHLEKYGIEEGYCQELVPGNTEWLPDFEKTNPFPSDLSLPVWHWREGFLG